MRWAAARAAGASHQVVPSGGASRKGGTKRLLESCGALSGEGASLRFLSGLFYTVGKNKNMLAPDALLTDSLTSLRPSQSHPPPALRPPPMWHISYMRFK